MNGITRTTEVEIKNIGELPDFVESIGKLEICLFNGEEMKMYKGISPEQKARLHNMITAFLASEHQHQEDQQNTKEPAKIEEEQICFNFNTPKIASKEDEIFIPRENLLETRDESTNNQPPLSRGESEEEMLSYSPAGDLTGRPHFKREFNLNIAIPQFDYEDDQTYNLSPISSFFKDGLFCDQ